MDEDNRKGLSKVVRIDAGRIEDHLRQIVRGSVEETLNSLLEAEADRLCNAGRHERSEARRDTRAGRSARKLHTRAGEVQVQGAEASQADASTTAIIERYRRRARSLEEALMEMYLAGVSLRRVSPSTVSNLNKKLYSQIETRRNRSIEGEHPYLYLDGPISTWTALSLSGRHCPEAQSGR